MGIISGCGVVGTQSGMEADVGGVSEISLTILQLRVIGRPLVAARPAIVARRLVDSHDRLSRLLEVEVLRPVGALDGRWCPGRHGPRYLSWG
jgi:hypothetical protein